MDAAPIDLLDREADLQALNSFLGAREPNAPRCLVYRTRRATGLTHFLRHRELSNGSDLLSVYIDLERNQQINAIFSSLKERLAQRYPWRWRIWDLRLHWKQRFFQAVRPILGLLIPSWGSLASETLGVVAQTPIFISPYASKPAAEFASLARHLSRKYTILILVDNCQQIDSASMDIFETTFSTTYYNVRYVLGFVDEGSSPEDFEEFLTRIEATGLPLRSERFEGPNAQLVRALARTRGITLSSIQARELAEEAGHHVHRILAAINRCGTSPDRRPEPPHEPLAEQVLGLLRVAGQTLYESDVQAILVRSPEVHFESIEEIQATLERLAARGWVELKRLDVGDRAIALLASSTPPLPKSLRTPAKRLAFADALYRYFCHVEGSSARHSRAEIHSMLFRLAKEVDPDSVPHRAQQLLDSAMKMGSISGARALIDSAPKITDLRHFYDYVVRVGLLISIKEYDAALVALRNPPLPQWAAERICRVLEAVCLNRCRYHEESLQRIAELLPETPTLEEEALLLSYKISGLLHQQQPVAAREVFEGARPRLEPAENYAYFLRNGAAALPSPEALRITSSAKEIFRHRADYFGAWTAVANTGSFLAGLGELEEAQDRFKRAFDGLAVFGIHHLEEAGCNFGLVQLLSGEWSEAVQHLERFLSYARARMPRLYAQMHLAAAFAAMGQRERALERLEEADATFAQVAVKTARQRYATNGALIALLAGAARDELDRRVLRARSEPHQVDRASTERVLQLIEGGGADERGASLPPKEVLHQYYSCGWLQYWSQNPLQVHPKLLLPIETV